MATTTADSSLPKIVRDPRFRAGRRLVETGQAANAGDVFATLLQEARATYGETNFECVAAYYEYGNALFRAQQRLEAQVEEEDLKQQPSMDPREAAAAAAERRANKANDVDDDRKPAAVESKDENKDDNQKPLASENSENDSESDVEDMELAVEMMETALAILDENIRNGTTGKHEAWAKEQLPRFLTGIGDIYSAMGRHGDAADIYTQALEYRQEAVAVFASDDTSLPFLRARRRLAEANLLIAEELLSCPPGQDVVKTETQQVIVSAAERVDYIKGYYQKARDELQETVLLMGQLASKGIDLEDEKENICFTATLVMGVGERLAEMDEQVELNKKKV